MVRPAVTQRVAHDFLLAGLSYDNEEHPEDEGNGRHEQRPRAVELETRKPERIAPPRLGRRFKCEVTSCRGLTFSLPQSGTVHRPAHRGGDETGEQAPDGATDEPPEDRCGGGQGSPEANPRGDRADHRSRAASGVPHARAVQHKHEIAGMERNAAHLASASDSHAFVIATIIDAMALAEEEGLAFAAVMIGREESIAHEGRVHELREIETVIRVGHGQPR